MVSTGRRNRVRPDGTLVATPERGTCWGNRGALLDARGELARHSRGRAWVVCVLELRGRHRTQWQPGRLTELYFLDEATALAAGHRPCGQCRHGAHRDFLSAWSRAHPEDPPGTAAVDARLHQDRLAAPGVHRTWTADLADLPGGTVVALAGEPWLVGPEHLQAWHPGGYRRLQRHPRGEVAVLTPRSTVDTIAAGYVPALHPSALVRPAVRPPRAAPGPPQPR